MKPRPRTGNVVLDMIHDAVFHYAKFKKKIDRVILSRSRWEIFVEGMKRLAPEVTIDGDEFHFNDIKVVKGSVLMKDHYKIELKNPIILAEAWHKEQKT